MQTAIVSASDAEYFQLLHGLFLSIRESRPDDSVRLHALDCGLTSPQQNELTSLGVGLVTPDWDYDFVDRPPKPDWYQAMTARSHLPKYFPDADILIWLDADCWLQDWNGVAGLIAGCQQCDLTVVPELHPEYKSTPGGKPRQRPDVRMFYEASFGPDIARQLIHHPIINAGVFAIRRESEVWQKWRRWTEIALKATPHKLSDQNALNAVVRCDKYRTAALGPTNNWICGQALPMFDARKGKFVVPTERLEPISILHVTTREVANAPIQSTAGPISMMPLDYIPFKQWLAAPRH